MNDDLRDELIADERLERWAAMKRRLRSQERQWGNATIEAERSNRLNIEYQEQIELHRREEEYAS